MTSLIAGVGNIFHGDDAFGVEVAQRLARRALPDGVQVVDFGIRGFDLAYALMEPFERVVLVDAVARGEAPGTLFVIEPDVQDVGGAEVDTHTMTARSVFALVKSLGGTRNRVLLLGCEPDDLGGEDGRMGLSAPVAAAVDAAAELALDLACGRVNADA
jgi:hydrogenase maturation protease